MNSPTSRKKVLFLITKSNWGGAQRYVYDLATHLNQNEFEPVVALGGNGELVTQLAHAGIRVITIETLARDISLKDEWEFTKELARIIRTERPDVLHVNSSKAGGVGTLLGRLLRVSKIIFTAHGWAFNEERPLWQKGIIAFLHYVTVLLSHRTIVVSHALMNQLRLPGAKRRMKVLHPGRTIGVMYEKAGARETLSIDFPVLVPHLKETWVGTIAELHPIKNQTLLIKAMATLVKTFPDLKLLIIGEGSERTKLQGLIETHRLANSVFLLGAITEAARLLPAFDIFTLTSHSEAYGYVVHEAGLAGLPVVATNVGGIPEIIDHGISGLLIPTNNQIALTEALQTLLTSDSKRTAYASALKAKMQERSLEKMVRATESLYLL